MPRRQSFATERPESLQEILAQLQDQGLWSPQTGATARATDWTPEELEAISGTPAGRPMASEQEQTAANWRDLLPGEATDWSPVGHLNAYVREELATRAAAAGVPDFDWTPAIQQAQQSHQATHGSGWTGGSNRYNVLNNVLDAASGSGHNFGTANSPATVAGESARIQTAQNPGPDLDGASWDWEQALGLAIMGGGVGGGFAALEGLGAAGAAGAGGAAAGLDAAGAAGAMGGAAGTAGGGLTLAEAAGGLAGGGGSFGSWPSLDQWASAGNTLTDATTGGGLVDGGGAINTGLFAPQNASILQGSGFDLSGLTAARGVLGGLGDLGNLGTIGSAVGGAATLAGAAGGNNDVIEEVGNFTGGSTIGGITNTDDTDTGVLTTTGGTTTGGTGGTINDVIENEGNFTTGGTTTGTGTGTGTGTAARTAISRILDGTATGEDWLSVLGQAAPGLISAFGNSQSAGTLQDIANQQFARDDTRYADLVRRENERFGVLQSREDAAIARQRGDIDYGRAVSQPSRDRYESSFAPGFSMGGTTLTGGVTPGGNTDTFRSDSGRTRAESDAWFASPEFQRGLGAVTGGSGTAALGPGGLTYEMAASPGFGSSNMSPEQSAAWSAFQQAGGNYPTGWDDSTGMAQTGTQQGTTQPSGAVSTPVSNGVFTMGADPGYTDALNQSAQAVLRGLSVQGNPAGNPTAWDSALQQIYTRNAYPALQQYRASNAATGGYSSFGGSGASVPGIGSSLPGSATAGSNVNTSGGLSALTGAAGADGGVWAGLGRAFEGVSNAGQQTFSAADIRRMFGLP